VLLTEDNNHIKITLRQEYVLLTGDYKKAILLEFFVIKQKESNEWFNISYSNISKNSLLGFNLVNIRRHISHLIKNDWIQRKKDEYSLLYQYKVNIGKIKQDVDKLNSRKG
jgi:hypothetical protein